MFLENIGILVADYTGHNLEDNMDHHHHENLKTYNDSGVKLGVKRMLSVTSCTSVEPKVSQNTAVTARLSYNTESRDKFTHITSFPYCTVASGHLWEFYKTDLSYLMCTE
jgi:hypothetical protein